MISPNNGLAVPLLDHSLKLYAIHSRELWDSEAFSACGAWRKNWEIFILKKKEPKIKKKERKKLKEEEKMKLTRLISQRFRNSWQWPNHTRVLLVITLVESWGNMKAMTNIILLTLLHMQWGSSNLKTQGQPNVLTGVEARPSQRKYKENTKIKKKDEREEKRKNWFERVQRLKRRKRREQRRQKEKEIKGDHKLKH